ncbi:iron-containing redox enzyme family protein [Caulobacter segnis]
MLGEARAELSALIVPLIPDTDEAVIAGAVARANAKPAALRPHWPLAPPRRLRPRRGRTHQQRTSQARGDQRPPPGLPGHFQDRRPRLTFYQRLVTETVDGTDDPGLGSADPGRPDGSHLARDLHRLSDRSLSPREAYRAPLMQAARARMDEAHQRFVAALDEYIAEETGHEHWILADIKNCGGDPTAVRDGTPREATVAMTDYAYDYIRNANPMGFLRHGVRARGDQRAPGHPRRRGCGPNLNLGPECFSYLTSHGALDMEHLTFFEKLMNQVDDPADQAAIIEVAKAIFERFAGVFPRDPTHPRGRPCLSARAS